MSRTDGRPRFLFVNENIGGHEAIPQSLRKILAGRNDIEAEFLDGEEPGWLGRLLCAPVPGLSLLDLDLQALREQLVRSWIMRRRVRERLAVGDIDAVHVYTQNTLLGGARLMRSHPTVITTDRTGRLKASNVPYRIPAWFTAPLDRITLLFERRLLQAATKVLANTRTVVESLSSPDYLLPPQRVRYLEMGVYSPYLTDPLPVRDPGRRPVVVFMGTPLECTGGALLLDIWRRELKERADLILITHEEVPTEPGLTVINDLQPDDDRLWGILADADIMCSPSVIDQAPEGILEAMAAGLPVVAHRSGAIPGMVLDGEAGFLVDCYHRENVADALMTLIDDPDLRARMGKAGHRHAVERYNMVDSAEVIVDELFRAVVTARRTSAVSVSPERGPLCFRIHDEVDAELEAQWRDLAERRSTTFASRPAYGLSWQKTLDKGQLAVATVHEGEQLVALLPLHARRRPGVTVHRWLGHGLGTIGEALAEDRAALDELVAGLHRSEVVLELTHVPEDSPLLSALLDHGGWTLEYRTDDHCPVIELPPGTGASDLRSAKTLSNLRRHRRKITRRGTPTGFEILRTPEDLERHWSDIVAVAAASEEGNPENRVNLCAPPYDTFTRSFLLDEALNGHLLGWALTVADDLAAFAIMLRTGTTAEGWITRFHPNYRQLKPGHHIIEDVCNRHDELGITRMDMMIGRSPYKSDWRTREYAVGTLRAATTASTTALPLVSLSNAAIVPAHTGLRQLLRNR